MDRENGQVKFYQPEITMKSHGFFWKKTSLEVLTGSLTLKITPGIPIRKGSSSCPIIFPGRAVELRGCKLRVELRFHSWGLHCIDNLLKL